MFCGGFGGFGPYGYGSGFGWILLAMGFRLLIFIGLIILAVKLFKNHNNGSGATRRILDEKFARGEISEEEYLKRRSVLSQRN